MQQIQVESNNIQHIKLMGLVTQNIYFRDLTLHFYKNSVKKSDDFEWLKMQKFKIDNDNISMRILNSTLIYGYEYGTFWILEGAFTRLVITPLTERCYLTITAAFYNKYGANPAGPAGTGKTECCKDMARVIARQCIVFNCSSQNDVKTLEQLFVGQITTGAWACLDEFNRIDVEVLSVVAMQLNNIHNALVEQRFQFEMGGRILNTNQNSGTFITFNPTYKNRSILPDNLVQLFLPIAMVIPDYNIVSENLFSSFGFRFAQDLGNKLTSIFHICANQFQEKGHYDFGMRQLKQIILLAGRLKKIAPKLHEFQILLNAVYMNLQSKFNPQDLNYF